MSRLRLFGALVVTLVMACIIGGCSGGGEGGIAVPPATGSLVTYRPFANQILGLFPFASNGRLNTSQAAGVRLHLDENSNKIRLEFLTRTGAVLGAPLTLSPLSGQSGTYRATNVAAFGQSGLTVTTQVRSSAPGTREVSIFITSPRRSPQIANAARVANVSGIKQPQANLRLPRNDIIRRKKFRDYYNSLPVNPPYDDLDRFAEMVQTIVDTDFQTFILDPLLIQPIVEDMGDLFLPENYKEELMNTPSVLQGNVTEPGRLTGYIPRLQKGEGRQRHFAANALMSYTDNSPYQIVTNLGARIVGGDFEFLKDPTGDIAADLETNEIGRGFTDLLLDLRKRGQLSDGHSAKDYIHQKFGNRTVASRPPYPPSTPNPTPTPTATPRPSPTPTRGTQKAVILNFSLGTGGSFPAGAIIGISRIRGGHIAGPERNCNAEHLHANTSAGITIEDTNGVVRGPFPDPDPTNCGYGETINIPL